MKTPWFFQGHFCCEFKAPHFCSKLVQSSTENDFTILELHGNGQNSHDFNFRVRGSTEVNDFLSKVSKFIVFICFFLVILCMKCCTITVSFVRLDLKLHAFWCLSKIYWTPCKLTSLEWKLHGFSRVIFCEFKSSTLYVYKCLNYVVFL